MIAQERFQSIGDLLAQRQKMSVHDLQFELGVSPATLRRDLAELEADGKLIRVRGAVVHPAYFRGEPTLAQKSRESMGVKRAIAKAAADLVPPNSSVLVDAGTTCLEVGRLLITRPDLTIITHSLPLATRAHEGEGGARVVLIGGELRAISGATVGALALSWMEKLRADWCFLGASGLSVSEGPSTTELSEAAMKQAILRRSRHKVLLSDSRKWDQPVTVTFAAWNEFDTWITGGDYDDQALQTIQKLGPRLVRVDNK